jgi:hypothetical protein
MIITPRYRRKRPADEIIGAASSRHKRDQVDPDLAVILVSDGHREKEIEIKRDGECERLPFSRRSPVVLPRRPASILCS